MSNKKPRKWLWVILLMAICTVVLVTGYSAALCCNDNNQQVSAGLLQIPNKIEAAFNNLDAALSGMVEDIYAKYAPQQEPTDPESTLDIQNFFPPVCPPFDKELGEIIAYEDIMYLNDGTPIDTACVSTYARTPLEYHDELYAEFVKYFGYEPAEYTVVTFEDVGQFYIDGKDYVPIYQLFIRDSSVPICDEEFGVLKETVHENGMIAINFSIRCELWGNGDSFDENSDCWSSLEAFMNTEEWRNLIGQMNPRMSELTGKTIEELNQEDEMHNVLDLYYMFISKARNSQKELFSVISITYRYIPPASNSV